MKTANRLLRQQCSHLVLAVLLPLLSACGGRGPSGGTATVSGSKSFSGTQSCGSSCVSSSNSANLTIAYNDYYAAPGRSSNTKVRLTGTVTSMRPSNGVTYSF